MKKLLIKYQEFLLIIVVVIFLGIIIYFFSGVIGSLANTFDQVLTPVQAPSVSVQFDFQGFNSLKFKGQ